MDISKQFQEQQEANRLHSRITSFIGDCQIGTLMNRCGMRKVRGTSPLKLFTAIFMLPFEGNNFYRGIVTNKNLPFGKNAAYALLSNPRHNWRRFLLTLAIRVINFFTLLTSNAREKVLVIDDSTYDRSRSKAVELLSWVFDHNSGKHLKGFKMLTLGWSDGASFIPLDFILMSSAKVKKRIQEIKEKLDKRTVGYGRRVEATIKSTVHLEEMVKRVLNLGVEADYILMDSWFCWPVITATLGGYLPVICMAKNMPTIFYQYEKSWITLGALYGKLRKHPGKAKILASVIVKNKRGQAVKIVFVRHRHKRDWLAILSTDTKLSASEIVRIYGKRWDIEVFFKMLKHHLNLEREVQLRDYQGIIAHVTITMARYIFLAFEQRCHDDPRSIGSLFFSCCAEIRDLSLLDALQRLLTLALDKILASGEIAKDVITTLLDAIMGTAIDFIQTMRLAAGLKIGNSTI
jgi:hypothetical protein